jgi:tetratricopeptide (TPR) repeat protein
MNPLPVCLVALLFLQVHPTDKAAPADQSATVDGARAEFEAGRYGDAARALESAVSADGGDAAAAYWLGRTRLEQRQYRPAIDALSRAVKLKPADAEYHRWLARAEGEIADREHSLGMARRVRQDLEQAVRLDPSDVAARRDLEGFYLEAPWFIGGGDGKALGQVEAIATLDPIAGHLARAVYWMHRKDPARARNEYTAAIEGHPEDIAPYLEVAVFYEKSGDAAGLRSVIREAERVDPGEPQLMYFRGVLGALASFGLNRARDNLTSYLAQVPRRSDRPDPAAAHEWLGRVHQALGHPEDAAAEYRKSLALEPGRKSARDRLQQLAVPRS